MTPGAEAPGRALRYPGVTACAAPPGGCAASAHREAAVGGGVDDDGVAVAVATLEQRGRQLVADLALDEALEGAGTERRVETLASEGVLGRIGDLEVDASGG